MANIVGYRWQDGVAHPQEGVESLTFDLMETVRKLVNQGRLSARRNLAALTPSNNLMRAAQEDCDCWQGHLPMPPGDALARARAQYYTGQAAAVVWAEGTIQPLEMVDALLHDPATSAVIDGDWNEMGVAFAGSPYNLRCVVFLGRRQGWPNQELPVQDAIQIGLREGLSFLAKYPAVLQVGIG